MQVTQHLSNQVTALAALTFSDWMLKGIDETIFESIQAMTSVLQNVDSCVGQAAQKVAREIAQVDVEDLKRAWTRAFCSGDSSVTPHRSVALTGLVMQEPRDEALNLMSDFGLSPEKDLHEPADHLGVLLAFLARLLAQSDCTQSAGEFALNQLDWVPWVREQLKIKQTDNTTTLALLGLLESILEDFFQRNSQSSLCEA